MTCPRYQELRSRLELAAREARAREIPLYRHEAFRVALKKIRTHAEFCEDCIAALVGAFPELKGRQLLMEPISETSLQQAQDIGN